MKFLNLFYLLEIIFCLSFINCGNKESNKQLDTIEEKIITEESNKISNQQVNTETNNIDLCRCLTEPGNSQWSIDNKAACNNAISRKLGVANWEKVNFSQNPDLNRKWDELVVLCTGTSKVNTGIEQIDKNNELVPKIGTSYGYIWESLNSEAQIYTTLAFDGLVFRSSAYAMNGETDSENFTKIIDISGKWTATDAFSAEGVLNSNNIHVSWTFSNDYTSLTNNKGVIFQRIRVK